MPSSATITAFYSFTANTKARASQLNTNFANFRGHIIPVNTDTNTASDQTHDLGSADYMWRTLYAGGIDLNISNTSSYVLSGTTGGGFKFSKAGTIAFSVEDDIVTVAQPMRMTVTAGFGEMAASPAINYTIASNAHIAGSTCTITTLGRPVFIGFIPVGETTGNSGVALTSDFFSATTMSYFLNYMRNGSTIGGNTVTLGIAPNGAGSTHFNVGPGAFGAFDFPAAGTYKYSLYSGSLLGTNWTGIIQNMKFVAFEL